jgi:hypothetical protein
MISESVDKAIIEAVENFDNSYELGENCFRDLLSMGELIDRLSIVNFKLFTLKNEVMKRKDNEKFRAWASVEDVRLVEERARLKKCIDEKMIEYVSGKARYNPETKNYG